MGRKGRGRLNKKTLTAAEIAIYTAYLKDDRKHSVPRAASGAYREKMSVGVTPFGVGLPAGTGGSAVRVGMTRGALGILGTLGISAADQSNVFGLEDDAAKVSDPPAGFYPALCIITLKPANVVAITTGTSAFTGRPRNYKPGRSGSVPFGRGSATGQPEAGAGKKPNTAIDDIEFADAMRAIKIAVAGGTFTGKKTMTFQPEIFRAVSGAAGFKKPAVAPVF